MIIPSSSSLKAALINNRSVFDLKGTNRRDSTAAPSISTVPPPYESRPASIALNQAGELLPIPGRRRHLGSDTASTDWHGSDDGSSTTASEYGGGIHRHRFHWHSDQRRETLVIQVQNTLFKIQPSILESYSPLLAELLRSLKSQPDFFKDAVEGCKTLFWPEAKAQEVAELLNRIYHINRSTADAPAELSPRSTVALVGPVLHYANKYSPSLRTSCVQMLEKIIPTNTTTLISRNRKGALRCQGDTAFRILHLVRLAGPEAREMLPFSFFLCARASTADIVETSMLGWEDKAHCLAGRDELSRILRFTIYRKYTESAIFSPLKCICTPKCSTSVAAARTLDKHLSVEIFGFFTKVDCVCCAPCAQEMHKEVKDTWLSHVWDQLPSLFRLGTWDGSRQQIKAPGD